MFVDGPLRALELAFQHWEKNSIPQPGVDAIRVADLFHTPFFPPMVAYAWLVGGPDGEHVELIDLDVDWEFFERNDADDK